MASAVVELTQQKGDLSLASKSKQSHVPMDVEPLNTSGEKHKEDTAKCNHFSIRGYVSEVRKKDPKICYPFSLENSAEPIELPPMVVPQFKWWQCTGCVPEASVLCVDNIKEAQKAEEIADTPIPLHLVGQSSRDIVPRVRNVEASTSIDSNDNRNYSPPQVLADRKGKGKAFVEDEAAPSAVFEYDLLKDSSQEPLQQSTGNLEVSLTAANEGVVLGSRYNENGIISNFSILQKDSRVEAVEADFTEEPMNCNEGLPNEQCRVKPQDSLDHCQVDSPITDVAPEVLGPVSGPTNESRSRPVNLPDLNECSGEPEPPFDENNEAIVTGSNDDVFCEDDDDYLGAERRKYPKFRLLSELLDVTEIKEPIKRRKKKTSVPNSVDENVKRKRVGSQDEGSKSVEIRNTNNRNKMMSGTSKISESDSDYETASDDVSTEIISKTLAKRRCKPRIPLNENKNKKTKVDRRGGSSVSRKKSSSKSGHEEGKTSDAVHRKSVATDQLVDRSSVVTKKRNKVFQSVKDSASFIPHKNRLPKESASEQKHENAEKNPVQKDQKVSEVQHLPKSIVIKRNGQVRVPSTPGADGFCLPPPQEEPKLADCSSIRKPQEKENNIGETSVAFKTTAVGTTSTGNPISGNEETNTAAKTFLKEQRSRIPEAEKLSPLAEDLPPKVSRPVENPKELANEVQRRIRDIDINSIPVDDKVAEDDIPMDIVELMAKNQYERHLSDRDEQHDHPPPAGILGKHIRDNGITNSNGECWQTIGQETHFLSSHNSSSTDARNYMANGNNSFHVSNYNHSHLSVPGCLPRGGNISARYFSPTHQRQEHGSSYPSPNGLALNNWNGTINVGPPQRYPSTSFLQAVESYRFRASAPRQNTTEGHVTWPSVMANCMPMGIANPQIISQSSNVGSKVKGHRQSSGSILNFNAAPANTHLRKQQNLNFSNAYSMGHSESSAGSTDMCTNEAISAMHLLSLMQNAAKMQNAALSLGPQKEVGTSSSRQHFVDNNSRASTTQNNSRHPCYPTSIAAARPNFGATFQNDRGNAGRNSNTGFVGPIPLTLQGQRNIESSHFTHPGVDHRPQRRQLVSPLDKGKGISINPLISSANPLHGVKDDAANSQGKGVMRDEKTNPPASEKEICQLNQNPSDFNDLRVLSRYMIGPEDLKPKGMVREKSSRPRGDAKRQDMRLNKPIPSVREREKQRKC